MESKRPLVIVESPTKARTISKVLGPDYVVESSVGHIRDLPRNADEVPESLKGLPWARLGVDVDNGFKPLYVIPKEKKQVVSKLKEAVRQAGEVYLATDEDREGESIAWHLLEVLSPQVPVKRMVFHEITAAAIQRAVREWRDLDRKLVDAQEARRILDRLYGYELSPVLWKKVMPRLSAGRVQSVACRMVVERERERIAFHSAAWWDVEGMFSTASGGNAAGIHTSGERDMFKATLWSVGSVPVATGKDFNASGAIDSGNRVKLVTEQEATGIAERLSGAQFEVSSVARKPYRRSPAAPFTTSTLQQEAGRKLRFGSKRAMQVAQHLYEQGWITYMRTDSTILSDEALQAARTQAAALYGTGLVPPAPRLYKNKVKNAQEAHEAIRPAGERFRTIDEARQSLSGDELHLYELVWKRTIASQMIDATGTTTQAKLQAVDPGTDMPVVMAASGTAITQMGFLKAYEEGTDAQFGENDSRPDGAQDSSGGAGGWLPPLEEGEQVSATSLESKSHATQPPPRFTEASLVKALEEKGIGRPSTYASIISTIQDRGYVWKKGSALVPSFVAFAVVGLLESHFPTLVDYGFTATMEDELDSVATGAEETVPWLSRFYFGNGASATAGSQGGLKYEVLSRLEAIDARKINEILLGTDNSGNEVMVRVGRYGPYIQRGDSRVSVPDDTCPDELTLEKALEMLDAPAAENAVLGTDPDTGLEVSVRSGRYGPYVQLGDDSNNGSKPKRASLFASMSTHDVTLETALKLLSLPRAIGTDPESGEEILAKNGRYGPYLERGKDTRSLENEDLLLSIDLDEALARFRQPKTRRGAQPATPLREIGTDTNSNQQITLRSGRYGPYVTDGTVNASLRTGDDPETVTLDRSIELLAARRTALANGTGSKPRRSTATAKTRAKKTSSTAKTKKAASGAKPEKRTSTTRSKKTTDKDKPSG
ncbi:MAG: type I DNA topoisomerase [Acidimicrobiales bacterium]